MSTNAPDGAAPDATPGATPERSEVRGAGGVVFRPDGAVLVLRHLEGSWVFPKGHLDPGESALEAALREVEEEAGVRARCPDPDFQRTTRYANARGVPRVVTWFCLLTDAEKPTLRESLFPGGDFLAPAEARSRLSFDEDRRLLDAVLAYRAEMRP